MVEHGRRQHVGVVVSGGPLRQLLVGVDDGPAAPAAGPAPHPQGLGGPSGPRSAARNRVDPARGRRRSRRSAQCSRLSTARTTRSVSMPGSRVFTAECQRGGGPSADQSPSSTRTGMPCSANTSSYQCRLASTAARSRGSMWPFCRVSVVRRELLPGQRADSLAACPRHPQRGTGRGRAVRVSSPDRVIYEATDRTPEVTKLMVAEFFASVDDGLMRALRDRPTALERWTSGRAPGHEARDRADGQGRGRVLPEARAEGRARLPRVGPGDVPVRPHCRRDLPDRDRGAGLVRAHGCADVPPLAGPP